MPKATNHHSIFSLPGVVLAGLLLLLAGAPAHSAGDGLFIFDKNKSDANGSSKGKDGGDSTSEDEKTTVTKDDDGDHTQKKPR